MSRESWEQLLAERYTKYLADLAAVNLSPGAGARLTCPSCRSQFWMTIPAKRGLPAEIIATISCTRACGYFGAVETFSPEPEASPPSEFDTTSACHRCEVFFATNGVVVRRPCCAIENPRELMLQAVARIRDTLDTVCERVQTELMLGFLVSEFDGIMRASLAIANENARYFKTAYPDHPLMAQMLELPDASSFQSLTGARQRLLPTGWDMEKVVKDWQGLVRLFQKRHTVAHRLGIVDQEYLDKTRDSGAVLGKRVPLSENEVIGGAEDCLAIVVSFFGNFLS